jgi:hypothetical protein
MEETPARLEKQFDAKKKVMKWIRKKLNKDSPLEFRRHVIKNTEIFSCSNMKKREGRRQSDLENALTKGIKMQVARTKVVTRNMPSAGYDNWIVWLKENKEGQMMLELWKPVSGDCIIILMSEVISVYCFDETVVLTNSDGEQFVFLTSNQSTMKQLQLIFKAASGDNVDAANFVKETPPRPSSFSNFISSSTPLKSNPHLAAMRLPTLSSRFSSGSVVDTENQDDNEQSQEESGDGVDQKRHSIVRRSQIMMRSPMMESQKAQARRRVKAKQPPVYHFSLPGTESPKSKAEKVADEAPPAPVQEEEVSKKSPKRTRSDMAVAEKSSAAADMRPAKRVSPPRATTTAKLSTSPKRIR